MIGSKRERIIVQRRTAATDNYGDFMEETWSTYTTVWAGVKEVRGKEFTAQDKTTSEVSHRFFIRYSDSAGGIQADDRIVYRSKNYNIVSIVDIAGRKREMEIAVKLRD